MGERARPGSYLTLLVVLAALFWAGAASAQGKDYFGRNTPQAPPAATAPGTNGSAVPAFLQRFIAQIATWQREMNDRLAAAITDYKSHGHLAPVIAILLISFLYGVFHAAGPGTASSSWRPISSPTAPIFGTASR